ncbi:hypothetical protein CEXT_34331 [Caerostris extrusa]|uniref:Uncharacterized protein n=1 Tax=Caerostris extrusa TaxID=172846 RepID=A0AAV4PJJ8_CAEEX|nr:hypothetical protein CEXT_34331 [Caerostris extrusa]
MAELCQGAPVLQRRRALRKKDKKETRMIGVTLGHRRQQRVVQNKKKKGILLTQIAILSLCSQNERMERRIVNKKTDCKHVNRFFI